MVSREQRIVNSLKPKPHLVTNPYTTGLQLPNVSNVEDLVRKDRVGSLAQGDVLYFNGTKLVNLAPGTSGKFLKTLGAGANPIWDTAAGTGLSDVLTDGNIFVGNASNVATGVNPSGDVDVSNAGVFSIASDVVVNADVKTDAAIALSKLAALTDGNIIVGSAANVPTSVNPSGDVDVSNTGVFSIAGGVVVNADVNASAAIDYSKLATLTSGNILVGSAGGVATSVNPSGDADISATGAITVSDLTIASEAQGDVLYFNGTNWVRLGPGTSGQFLKTQGAGANPIWASVTTTDPGILVRTHDTTAVAVTATTQTTIKTYTGLTFTTGKAFRITVNYNIGGGAPFLQIRIGDGTNVTDGPNVQISDNGNGYGCIQWLVSQAAGVTTAMQVTGWTFHELMSIVANMNTQNDADVTIAASGTWAGQTQILLRGRVSAATMNVTRVIIEELTVTA